MTTSIHVEATDSEKAALQGVATKLDLLLAASGTFLGQAVNSPKPGSRMDRANVADLRESYDFAGSLLFAAEDHLRAIRQLLRSGVLPTFALYTLTRGAAEAVVRCRYLLDLQVMEPGRLARGLNERLVALRETRKLHNLAQKPHYDSRITHLEQRAKANGIKVVRDKKGKMIVGFHEHTKTATDHFAMYFPAGSTVYRFLCSHAHSNPLVQLQFGDATPSTSQGITNVPAQLNVTLFTLVLSRVLDLHDEAVGNWIVLAGYPLDVWREAKKGSGNSAR